MVLLNWRIATKTDILPSNSPFHLSGHSCNYSDECKTKRFSTVSVFVTILQNSNSDLLLYIGLICSSYTVYGVCTQIWCIGIGSVPAINELKQSKGVYLIMWCEHMAQSNVCSVNRLRLSSACSGVCLTVCACGLKWRRW